MQFSSKLSFFECASNKFIYLEIFYSTKITKIVLDHRYHRSLNSKNSTKINSLLEFRYFLHHFIPIETRKINSFIHYSLIHSSKIFIHNKTIVLKPTQFFCSSTIQTNVHTSFVALFFWYVANEIETSIFERFVFNEFNTHSATKIVTGSKSRYVCDT